MHDTSRIRVAIANDYELVVLGLAAALEPYADRIEVVELNSSLTPVSDVDVVLYDTFAQATGNRLDVRALTQGGLARVVIFSWRDDPAAKSAASLPGVAGFIPKGMPTADIVQRIEAVGRGQVVAARDLAAFDRSEWGTQGFQGAWPGQTEGLSERESETVALIVQGLSNREIAEQTFVTVNTVKTHIRTAYQKMGVVRRSQAVLWGMEHGFAPIAPEWSWTEVF